MTPTGASPVSGPAMAAALKIEGAATLGESGAVAMRARIRAAWPGATLAGPAFTASCAPGDNLAIHVATAVAPVGSVIVAEVADQPELGYWGEVLATAAEARRLAGLVIDGGVRDTAALAAHGFGVFSTMVALRGATKDTAGSVGGPVQVGDVEVRTGDWVVGDSDGVVVIAATHLHAVLQAATVRTAREHQLFEALRAGATTVELLDLDVSPVTRLDL
ncbi:MAG: Demethylmenaquinone methyltransferase [Acidimicrobiales bacterium]|nr:Demethylmenaquinone methyltransferase [Acidimicrobiales bacterium]